MLTSRNPLRGPRSSLARVTRRRRDKTEPMRTRAARRLYP